MIELIRLLIFSPWDSVAFWLVVHCMLGAGAGCEPQEMAPGSWPQTRLLAIKPRSQWIKSIIDNNGKHMMQKGPTITDGLNFKKYIHVQNSGQAF